MDKISDFITFPKTFDNYKWYKPLLVLVVALIIYGILQGIILFASYELYGLEFLNSFSQGYGFLDSQAGQIIADLSLIIFIPALYIASRIVKDRPFSSYSSSRGGWNFKLYFKALAIPLIMLIIFEAIEVSINGSRGIYHFTWPFFIASLILVPLQCIAEEYMFRSWLMQTLGSWFKIPVLAIVLQAIIFAAGHGYNSLGIFEVFIFGVIAGFFTWKTNGIEVSSAFHSANNLICFITSTLGFELTKSTITLNEVAVIIVMDLLIFLVMYYVGMKTDWFGEIKESEEA